MEYQQVCISKDSVQFDTTVIIFYRIVDSLKTAYRLGDMNEEECLSEMSSAYLRNIAG